MRLEKYQDWYHDEKRSKGVYMGSDISEDIALRWQTTWSLPTLLLLLLFSLPVSVLLCLIGFGLRGGRGFLLFLLPTI